MPRFEFHPITRHVQPIKETQHPYIKARVDTTDKTWVYQKSLSNWSKSATCRTGSWQNESWVGLNSVSTASTCDFTQTITLPENGLYRVEVMTSRGPADNGSVQLFVDSTQIGNTMLPVATFTDLKWRMQFPTTYFKSGSHSFDVKINKACFVAWIAIFKINRFEGGNQHVNDSNSTRLDISEGDFTQNTITDTNLLNLKVPMKEEFYDDNNPYSLLHFDLNDHVTLWLGSNRNDVTAMFGGYLTDLAINDDALTLTAEDRLFDFKRKPIYRNFKIGNPAVDTNSDTTPFTQFSDAYRMITTLAQCPEYPIATYEVPRDYGFINTFSTVEEYNKITSTVFRTEWDIHQGKPKPSLKVGLGGDIGSAETVLYEDADGYDAYVYNHLNLSYFTGGAGSRYPLKFNLKISMYRADLTVDDAVDYVIHFNGSTASNVITSVTPQLDGSWHDITLDLKALFDVKAPSTQYNITKVSMFDTVTEDMLASRRCSTIWIDSVLSYKDVVSTASYASQDVKTPFQELQGVCEECNLVAYVKYGEERADDVLVVQPFGNTVITESIEEGLNLLEINDWAYSPIDDGFVNQKYCTFIYTKTANNKTTKHTGHTFQHDPRSVLWYGAYQTFEHLDDTNTRATVEASVKNTIINGAWKYSGSTAVIPGCTILQPSQYVLTQVGSRHISGVQSIKSIKHEFKFTDDTYYNTTIDLNRPGDYFNSWLATLKKDLRNSGNKHNAQSYTDESLKTVATSGLGVYQ